MFKPIGCVVILLMFLTGCGGGGGRGELPGGGVVVGAPPEVKKGTKLNFTCTNDHPLPDSLPLNDPVMVEDVRGNWLFLSRMYKNDKGVETKHTVWVNFNNVVWYRIVD
jgi:hypothetical protein